MTDEATPAGDGLAEGPIAPPIRAMRLTLTLEADDRLELASALRNKACQIEREELTTGVSGGPYSGAIYELLHDPRQTHAHYFLQVQKYLREKKAACAHSPEQES